MDHFLLKYATLCNGGDALFGLLNQNFLGLNNHQWLYAQTPQYWKLKFHWRQQAASHSAEMQLKINWHFNPPHLKPHLNGLAEVGVVSQNALAESYRGPADV